MSTTSNKSSFQVPILLVVVGLGAASIWYWGPPSSAYFKAKELNQEHAWKSTAEQPVALRNSTQDQLVTRYITAYKTGNCVELSKCTAWIQERLRTIETAPEELRDAERQAMCTELFARDAAQSQVSILGISDQYLIPVTASFTIEGADAGREDLEVPVLERVWVVFNYADSANAPRDENGEAIRSLRAGINISLNHMILKGSVQGNWEIDFDSISHNE